MKLRGQIGHTGKQNSGAAAAKEPSHHLIPLKAKKHANSNFFVTVILCLYVKNIK
jgi:hypothetical protein